MKPSMEITYTQQGPVTFALLFIKNRVYLSFETKFIVLRWLFHENIDFC